jgi:hypothetical protein
VAACPLMIMQSAFLLQFDVGAVLTWYMEKPTPMASPRSSKRILPSGVSTSLVRRALVTAYIGAAGLLDGVQQREGGGIGIQVKCTRIGTVGFFVGLVGGNGHGVAGDVLGTGGVDAFGVFPATLMKVSSLTPSSEMKMVSILFLRIWVTILEASGMIAAENDGLGAAAFDFLDNGAE